MPVDVVPDGARPIRRHSLSAADFDTLAGGGGGGELLTGLWDAERSQRLILLDLYLDLVGKRPEVLGPLPAADEAWHLLLRAEQRDRAAVEDLLLRPETGLWLAAVLRRLRAGPPAAEAEAAPGDTAPGDTGPGDTVPAATGPGDAAPVPDAPLWVDVGELHVLSAAAALRAGLDFAAAVPVRHGTVTLPSVGRIVLPGAYGPGQEPSWECARVTYDQGELTVTLDGRCVWAGRPGDTGGGVGWEPARTVALPLPDGDTTVLIDDLGSRRIVPTPTGLPPGRLSDAEARQWADLLREAGPLLAAGDAQSARDVAALLRSVEPLPTVENERLSSATSGEGVGRLASGRPADALQLAAVLAHEIQHSKLAVLMHLYRLYEPDDGSLFYAPWRDDPRPLRGLLHGVYAFTGVARFWRGRSVCPGVAAESAAAAHFEYALWRRQLLRAIRDIQQHPGLTHLGRRVFRRLRETIASWEDPGPAQPSRAMAEDAADHHTMRWRLHHLAPDQAVVRTLARIWPRRLVPRDTGEPLLTPDPQVPRLDTVASLYRLRLTDPGALEKVVGAPQSVTAFVPDASGTELLQVLGDTDAARELSATAIREGEGDASSWACLALALRAQVLLYKPELARAVYEAVRADGGTAPDPVTFTAWLDGLTPMP